MFFGGQERTQREWQQLLDVSQLRLTHIWPTPSSIAIIEVEHAIIICDLVGRNRVHGPREALPDKGTHRF